MSDVARPPFNPDSSLLNGGYKRHLEMSTMGRNNNNNNNNNNISSGSSSGRSAGPEFPLNSRADCRTIVGEERDYSTDYDDGRLVEEKEKENEGRGVGRVLQEKSDATERAGLNGGHLFRVRLSHTTSPRTHAKSLGSSMNFTPSAVDGAAHRKGPTERMKQRSDMNGISQKWTMPTTIPSNSANNTTNGVYANMGRNDLREPKKSSEEMPVQLAQEQRLANESEMQMCRKYEANIAGLEGRVHASQRAVSGAQDEVLHKEAGWQAPRTSMVQKFNEDDVANIRSSLEATLKEREKDLAETREALREERARLAVSLQREEVLRSRLLVAEETSVLYRLYLERLLDLLRTRSKTSHDPSTRTDPLVTKRDILAALNETLRSTDAATNEDVDTFLEFTPQGKKNKGKAQNDLHSSPEPSRGLTNATLLKLSMLESTVTDCTANLGREEKRRHDAVKQVVKAAVNGCTEDMEAKFTILSTLLGKMDQRVTKFGNMAAIAVESLKKTLQIREDCTRNLKEELGRVNGEYTQSQRRLRRVQLENNGLRDEVRRMDGDREVSMLIHRAAECLEDVRQSVRSAARSAAHDIEERTLECNTLKEPFLQSMRVIAMKVESHAEIARTAVSREQREAALREPIEAPLRRRSSFDSDEMRRFLLTPPRQRSSCSRERGYPASHTLREEMPGGSKNLLVLEELGHVMKNLCQLLDNNARQMDANTAKLSQIISHWEESIVNKMTEIWGFMREVLAAGGLHLSAPAVMDAAPRRGWSNDTSLALGDTSTNHRGRALMHLTQPSPAPTTAAGPKSTYAGSLATSGSCAPSTVSSVEVSQATDSALVAPSWRAPLAPSHDVVRTPELHKHDDFPRHFPPSIDVSRTPTPPPPSVLLTNTAPPAERPPQARQEQQHQQHQQRQLFMDSQYDSPFSVSNSAIMLRMHHTGELNSVERNDTRSASPAVAVHPQGRISSS